METISPAEIQEMIKGGKAEAKPKKKKGQSDWAVARDSVESYGVPLAFHAGEIWAYRKDQAWVPETMRFLAHLNKKRGRNTRGGAYDIVCAQLAIPALDQIGMPVLYWIRKGDMWDGRWEPFNVQDHELLFSDELVDLKTGETIPLDDAVIFGPRITLPWAGPEEEDQTFRDMVEFAFPEPTIRLHFQEVMSQVLQPHVHLRGQIILYGPGHTMKSSIATAVCSAMAGTFGFSSAQEAELVRDKWASLALLNKFVNLSDDSPTHQRWVSWMKRYTAGTLLVEPKYHRPQSVVPTAKLLSTCNELPEMQDASGAAGMRVIPFQLTKVRNRSTDRAQDQFMTASFWCRTEQRQAVLSWLIEGAMRVIERGKYAPPPEWDELQDKTAKATDPVGLALLDLVELDSNGFVPTQNILAMLPSKVSSQKLSTYMERFFPASKKEKRNSSSGRHWGYAGVRIA